MKLRSVNTSFWSDPFIEDLTPSEKLLYLYLITNEKTNMLGIYEVSLKKMSFDTGIDKATVSKALKGFERLGKVKYINNYIVLTKYLKHQSFNTNMKKSAIDCYNDLPQDLKFQGVMITKSNPLEGFETLLNHYGILSKVEVEVEVKVELEKEDEEGVIFPFNSDEFKSQWHIWKDYKKREFKFTYKSKGSEQAALKKLADISCNIEHDAIQIIHASMANGWKGFFELKQTKTNDRFSESATADRMARW